MVLPCGHLLHENCFRTGQARCPICRGAYQDSQVDIIEAASLLPTNETGLWKTFKAPEGLIWFWNENSGLYFFEVTARSEGWFCYRWERPARRAC
eukprot:10879223-Karenia_brevis.AAC.1